MTVDFAETVETKLVNRCSLRRSSDWNVGLSGSGVPGVVDLSFMVFVE